MKKNKWIILFGTLFIISWFYQQTTTKTQTSKKYVRTEHHTPENTIIAFDIHGVITRKYVWPMLKTAYRYPNKWNILKSCSWSMLRKTFRCLWNKEWNRMRKLFEDENSYLFEFMHDIANTQTPIKVTGTIIKQLKELGYELHILSNISKLAYTSFKEKFPEIFNLFDIEQISFWDGDQIIEKPQLEYFKRYIEKYNPKNKKIIFIDDQKININAAEKVGIIGIRFKNAGQLKKALHKLKVI